MLPAELLVLFLSALASTSLASSSVLADSNASMGVPRLADGAQFQLAPSRQQHSFSGYKCYAGSLSAYPAPSSWLPFPALWDINREQILSSNGGDTYLRHYIHTSILSVAEEAGVDARLVLAAVMQESRGRADVECRGSAPRCGILHAPKGHSFNPAHPAESVLQMVREGIVGSPRSGPAWKGLVEGRPRMTNVPPGNAFAAARAYNSGSVGGSLDVVTKGEGGYVNDLANRLLGWDGRGRGFQAC